MIKRNRIHWFFIKLFCTHRWAYNYKKNYFRCKDCGKKVEK